MVRYQRLMSTIGSQSRAGLTQRLIASTENYEVRLFQQWPFPVRRLSGLNMGIADVLSQLCSYVCRCVARQQSLCIADRVRSQDRRSCSSLAEHNKNVYSQPHMIFEMRAQCEATFSAFAALAQFNHLRHPLRRIAAVMGAMSR